jgi:hypothetical protein
VAIGDIASDVAGNTATTALKPGQSSFPGFLVLR